MGLYNGHRAAASPPAMKSLRLDDPGSAASSDPIDASEDAPEPLLLDAVFDTSPLWCTGSPSLDPDTSLDPEESLPESSLPESSLPEASLPEASLPEASLPDDDCASSTVEHTMPLLSSPAWHAAHACAPVSAKPAVPSPAWHLVHV